MVIKITVSLIQSSFNKGRDFDVLRLLRKLTLSFCRIEMRQSMGKYLFYCNSCMVFVVIFVYLDM